MPRSNETDRLARIIEALPRLGTGCFSYAELAEEMGCGIEDARRTVRQLADGGAGDEDFGIATLTPEEVNAAIGRFGSVAREKLGKLAEHGGIAVTGRLGILAAPMRLNAEEGHALLLALDYAGIPEDSRLRGELERCVMPPDTDDEDRLRVYIDTAADHRIIKELSILCLQGRLADIVYASESAGPASLGENADAAAAATRTIAPLELYTGDNGRVYLGAYAYDRKDVRTFRTDRIAEVFPRADHASPEVRAMRGRQPFVDSDGGRAVLAVAEGVCLDERKWLGIEPLGDGRASLPLRKDTAWLCRHIVARLGDVDIIEPDSLRADVTEYARSVLDDIKALKAEYRRCSNPC